ncbi:toll/interleukin-1 receptor domain-containing protein [Mycobacterium sp. UM_WGJ]|uniref:toll/interleukin-1 receptor domain-containing protein n=1 Tax=Mycobacterium sp. UM_WGJ TaxID=1370120 RepID=UPI0018CB6851|nr:toll/interleukin-1 receptor domain-containing protein [Mycobacterium sp. UM_WGJ]
MKDREIEASDPVATCFISYNHADKPLAEALAEGLRKAGYRVWIDSGELRVGDSLVAVISSAIEQVDFLVALVSSASVESNWCQKEISLAMTGEIAQKGITVLPCQVGGVAMPATLADKLYLQINPDMIAEAVATLDRDMKRHLVPSAPLPLRKRGQAGPRRSATQAAVPPKRTASTFNPHIPVTIAGVDAQRVGKPRNDGTRGSALYTVPFTLSTAPDGAWCELFVQHWNQPPRFTTMHRPGNASVSGDRIILTGTTMDEVEKYHVETLRLVIETTNRDRLALAQRQERERQAEIARSDEHQKSVDEIAQRLKFDQ